eukprot:340723_1
MRLQLNKHTKLKNSTSNKMIILIALLHIWRVESGASVEIMGACCCDDGTCKDVTVDQCLPCSGDWSMETKCVTINYCKTFDPTIDPTIYPTIDPTIDPTNNPSNYPTNNPSNYPTNNPSN